MEELKLEVNERKTRCLRCPEEGLEFLGYRIGRNYRAQGRGSYIGTRPSQASVQSICRKISERTAPRNGNLLPGEMVEGLNRMMTGWANYFSLGQVSPAYRASDRHAVRRLRQWLCRRHKVRSGGTGNQSGTLLNYWNYSVWRFSRRLERGKKRRGNPGCSGLTAWPNDSEGL